MKKLIIMMLILMPIVYSWDYPTHVNIATTVADNLNITLDMGRVREGAIAPDKDFKDTVNHHYPQSYYKAVYWLDKAKIEYSTKHIEDASYSFGVASHYIADSFSDPHYISKESSSQHSKYEDRGYYRLKTGCNVYYTNLNETIYLASKENHWQAWLDTQSSKLPESRLEEASKALYSTALLTFNTGCKTTKNSNSPIAIILAAIIVIIVAILALLKYYKK